MRVDKAVWPRVIGFGKRLVLGLSGRSHYSYRDNQDDPLERPLLGKLNSPFRRKGDAHSFATEWPFCSESRQWSMVAQLTRGDGMTNQVVPISYECAGAYLGRPG